MAKIVILAGGADAEAASAALEAAGVEFKVVEPTAENLLHMVIGIVGDDEKPEKEEKPKEEKPAPTEETPPEDANKPAPAEEEPVAEVLKSLGTVSIDGEVIEAFEGKDATSVLFATTVAGGAKTTYTLVEGTYSFYPANPATPSQRLIVEHEKHRTSLELEIRQSATNKSFLLVGADLADMFKTK